MTEPALTSAQRELLRRIPERFPVANLDRLWIFPPRVGKGRETGLLVLSHTGHGADAEGRRAVVTIRYSAEATPQGVRLEDVVTEEGWARPEQIQRVIAGVLARGGEAVAEPLEECVQGQEALWDDLLARHVPVG